MAGILSGDSIARAVGYGSIEIDPFNTEQLNPVSYDLTLGSEVRVYRQTTTLMYAGSEATETDGSELEPYEDQLEPIDVKREPDTMLFRIHPEEGWVLKPRIGYLLHTRERIHTSIYVPVIDGKSSLGRLFLQVHATAGFGDPGFNGQYTLEVTVTHPVRVYAGMRIAQIRFHEISGRVNKLYQGNYQGEAAKGPVPSRAWKMFRSDT